MARSLFALLVLVGSILVPTSAAAADGPPLSVPEAALEASLHCPGDLAGAGHNPVLLVAGTTLTPDVFAWNYEPELTALGRPFCTVALPDNGMADIQVAAEYVVHAIRAVSAAAGRDVDIVGHSQGGMIPRWALKYWPDTRARVGDVIGLAPSNHGTVVAQAVCLPGCAPAFWQQRAGSAFLTALNSGAETWAGIDYTNVYTVLDEVVAPNLNDHGSSSLHTGQGRISNVGLQEVCPAHVADHLTTGTTDGVAFALVVDALTHDGPADPARLPADVCTRLLMPGVDPVFLAVNEAQMASVVATQVALYPHVAAEPPLAAYAR
ncbi:lipase family alpha/beta hydrolase [Amycolatopsis thermophila]|uniref:Pimeloyl-ACP methyl ester carboxylesterase n=1 Tax=Amycolatopsis thermophila TaxID=206084 RepID=A0ABU0EP35_9PSEU|nr:lipase [Amycolatopsis thermophila]MDQ0377058.1 pimeloyl-ACP methyl ester carboxylesterase [Amycolatopsis thermophila]